VLDRAQGGLVNLLAALFLKFYGRIQRLSFTMDQNQVRLRPAELPITDTRRFNWANGLSLFLDYYAPNIDIFGSSNWKCPVVMYVHGGGHIIGSRKDYSRPLFASFLENGCIVVSIDYRLMPENTMEAQLEDIEAAQRWCKYILLPEVKPRGFAIDESMFILVGASSGAFLALVSVRVTLPKLLILLILESVAHGLLNQLLFYRCMA
jgi:acetyl esterase/lipase